VTRDEDTVRQLLAAVDAGDTPRALGLLTDDVHFRFGSAEPTVGRDGVAANAAALRTTIAGLSHELDTIWAVDEPDPAVICETAVTYERHDGSRLTLPCLNVFRLREGRIADYRIYMDINPLFAPVAQGE
jgi:ketosteroid isomerase-like protein